MKIEIAVIRGDGVGPEMMDMAELILQEVCSRFNHELQVNTVLAAGEAIEACGNPLPEKSLELCKNVSAVLLGNTGLKKYSGVSLDKRPEYALMRLRRELNVTTNIRPVFLYPELMDCSPLKTGILEDGIDLVFIRDIVGGILCSDKITGDGAYGKEAYEFEYYNEKIVTDTVQIAFEAAQERTGKLWNLDKSNVLESSRLWRKTVNAVGKQYPEVHVSHEYIDTAAMKLMVHPGSYDVITTSNLFGDIISDEGTQMTGTPGLYGSAEVGKDRRGIYTPNQLHHPDETMIGKQEINPIGMIAAVALMLRYTFHLKKEAIAVEDAIKTVITAGYSTKDIWLPQRTILNTKEIGEQIKKALK